MRNAIDRDATPARSKSRTTASGVTIGWTAGAPATAARYLSAGN